MCIHLVLYEPYVHTQEEGVATAKVCHVCAAPGLQNIINNFRGLFS